MLFKLIRNHVFSNLIFLLILFMGVQAYITLPREQDPSINFNWIQITTILSGVSAEDIEIKVTEPLEEAIEKVKDVKFVSSNSRESISSILVRFHDVGDSEFDKRVADLRREIQNVEDQLPEQAETPNIYEVTTANAFPSATLLIHGPANDENLRRQARRLERDLARIPGVDRVQSTGLHDPEIQVIFDPDKVQNLGITPATISDTIRSYYRDVAAGSVRIADDQWLIRIKGESDQLESLAQLPLIAPGVINGELRIGDLADIVRARAKADRRVRFQGNPAIMFAIMKREKANTLKLLERIKAFIQERNTYSDELGVTITLADDQSDITRNALKIMQTNAMVGLFFVLVITWLFLGTRISLFITIGIPFTLAGTFILLSMFGQTLNTSVLLGVVIALGMLVDDAVVVVESIYDRLRRGIHGMDAVSRGLNEVIAPVTASVLTTMAVFLPLMLLPGILGKFMMVIPLVVTLALAISLIEAYWMLPAHILVFRVNFNSPSRTQQLRQRLTHRLKINYGFLLLKVMRRPIHTLIALLLMFSLAVAAVATGKLKVDFFAADSLRLFYINVEMPITASLDESMTKVSQIETIVRQYIKPEETLSVVSYAGQMFTETAPMFGEHYAQMLVSLLPKEGSMRSVNSIIDSMRDEVVSFPGAENISFMTLSGGPPTSKAISVKVRGDNYIELRKATDALTDFMKSNPEYRDISDDDSPGRSGLTLRLNSDALTRSGIAPEAIYRNLTMLVDGEVAVTVQSNGDPMAIRVKSLHSKRNNFSDTGDVLRFSLPAADGTRVSIRELMTVSTEQVKGNLRHYNFRRTITLESEINKDLTDTLNANEKIVDVWGRFSKKYPSVSLDFTGELDDIQESMDAILTLFLFGLGLVYLILSTQFRSYLQPLIIIVTIPMAFTGVVMGLMVTNNPLSLFTLYGVVALAGIAVNAAIVLISTANRNIDNGMSIIHASFYAARRRMLPIIITTLTTVGGLFSLATGLGGKSLIWGPVATAIVSGLMLSSLLSMFVVPVLFMQYQRLLSRAQQQILSRS